MKKDYNFNLEKLGKEWLNFNRNSLKKSSLQTYEYLINKHINKSGLSNCSIKEISTEDIIEFSGELLGSKLSAKSTNSVLMTINAIFKYANNMYGVETPYIKYVKDIKSETRVLSVNEQKVLERFLKNNMNNYCFGILFALYTGVRIGELCALKWGDVEEGVVKINKTMHRLRDANGKSVVMIDKPKTVSSNRAIPLPDFLRIEAEKRRTSPDSFLLADENIERVEPRLLQKRFKAVTDACGLKDVTFHTLRHTFATRCIECGFDPKTLSEILGHSDVKTTLNRYVHCSLELKKSSMNLLDKITA